MKPENIDTNYVEYRVNVVKLLALLPRLEFLESWPYFDPPPLNAPFR